MERGNKVKRTTYLYTLAILAALAFVVTPAGSSQERQKYNIKTTHLGPNDVAIVCLNGADPTGWKTGNTLIISCGK